MAAIPLIAVGVVDGAAVLGRHSSSPAPLRSASSTPGPAAVAERRAAVAAAARAKAVREVLARRADAVMTRNRTEWRSILDPQHPAFLRRQLRVFDNLAHVRFRSWSYRVDAHRALTSRRTQRYGAPTWSPSGVTLAYRLRGFDRRATSLTQYPTFVRRTDGWFLTSFDDFVGKGKHSSTDLWDYGPVIVVRTADVLVLGHPGEQTLMQDIAGQVADDIPRVSAVWGHDWSERAVVLVPASQRELGKVVADYGDLDNIAAVATAEVQLGSGRPDPVGDRVGINPANWPRLSALGQRIVLTHELTHVATRAVTSAATPTWLAEGFADYVAYLGSGVPTTFVAQDLSAAIRSGHSPQRLPTSRSFNGASAHLSIAYEGSWLACRLIAAQWGQRSLVRLYEAVGRSNAPRTVAVAQSMHRVLDTSAASFLTRWRDYVHRELG